MIDCTVKNGMYLFTCFFSIDFKHKHAHTHTLHSWHKKGQCDFMASKIFPKKMIDLHWDIFEMLWVIAFILEPRDFTLEQKSELERH